MKDWLNGTEGQELYNYLLSGCAEGGIESIEVPIPFAFVEQALTYTASKYDRHARKPRWHNQNTERSKFRISLVCDGSKLYMSFCCINTGLKCNIYTQVESTRPFSVLINGKDGKGVPLNVKKEPIVNNNENEQSFLLFVSSEIFVAVHRRSGHWRTSLQHRSTFFTRIIQRERLSPSGVGVGIAAYAGMRPFRAVANDHIVEYRRNKNVTINYGLTQQELIDVIKPESVIGMKPKHGRWLLNKASQSSSIEKGELIIHFKPNTVGFCGASPASDELTLEYGNHGSGRERGKYRSYYNDGTEQTISVQRESISTKSLNSLVNSCDLMYFGVADNKTLLGWNLNDVIIMWEQDIMSTTPHPLLETYTDTLKELHCEEFMLPNIINVFTLPDFLQGYDATEKELTDKQVKMLKKFYNARCQVLQLEDRKTTPAERALYNKGNPPSVVTPEDARTYVMWAENYEQEQRWRKQPLSVSERKFIRYLTERAK